MNQKIRILWCDKNIELFDVDVFFSGRSDLQVITFEDTDLALQHLEHEQNYKLIIWSNKDGVGLKVFTKLNSTLRDFQFLLFTGDTYSDYGPFSIMRNFNLFYKLDRKSVV